MDLIILLALLLLAVFLLFVIFSAFWGFLLTQVPFVPTRKADIEFIVKELGVSSKDKFYDLGSGNGKVVFLVHELTGATCIGFELTWWTHLWAKMKSKLQFSVKGGSLPVRQAGASGGKNNRIEFHRKNFFKADWAEADFIYAYLYPPLMGRVKEKFLKECKPGSTAIIRDFPFPNIKPKQIYRLPKKHEIYVYQI